MSRFLLVFQPSGYPIPAGEASESGRCPSKNNINEYSGLLAFFDSAAKRRHIPAFLGA
ncbi:hypothetical protein [uncultured Bosea sp.]|uniref:hypothetical protein n=1 Tax=uncultured Bosea sp. TaxID=211457 RepID=UPI0025D5E30D|nr:hypothetical protein [uncultured Bosea sp.]